MPPVASGLKAKLRAAALTRKAHDVALVRGKGADVAKFVKKHAKADLASLEESFLQSTHIDFDAVLDALAVTDVPGAGDVPPV